MKAVPLRFGILKKKRIGGKKMIGFYVGVDLHRNNFTYCMRLKNGEEKMGKLAIRELKGFAKMFGVIAITVKQLFNMLE